MQKINSRSPRKTQILRWRTALLIVILQCAAVRTGISRQGILALKQSTISVIANNPPTYDGNTPRKEYASSEPESGSIDSTTPSQHSIYLGLAGNGFGVSLNYDYRFSRWLSMRVGAGYSFMIGRTWDDSLDYYWPVGNAMVHWFPLGRWGNGPEIGAGAAYVRADKNTVGLHGVRDNPFIPLLSVGYRSQPIDGGFIFKGDVLIVLWHDYHSELRFGIELGYSF